MRHPTRHFIDLDRSGPQYVALLSQERKAGSQGVQHSLIHGKGTLADEIENKYGNVNLTIVRGERPNVSFLFPNIVRYVDQTGQSDQSTELPDKCELALA